MGFTLSHELGELLKYYGGDKSKTEKLEDMKSYISNFLNPERFYNEEEKAQEIIDKVNAGKTKNAILLLISEEMFNLDGMGEK